MFENFAKGRERRRQLLAEKKKKKEKQEFHKLKNTNFELNIVKNRERNMRINLNQKLFLSYDDISCSSEVCIVEKHKPQKVVRKVVKPKKKKQNQQPKHKNQ